MVLKDLLANLRDLVQRYEPGNGTGTSPSMAWVPQQGGERTCQTAHDILSGGGSRGGLLLPVYRLVLRHLIIRKKRTKKADSDRLPNSAKCKVYVCFDLISRRKC